MDKDTTLLEEIIVIAKKYGYTVSDCMLNNPRIEIGMLLDDFKEASNGNN